MSPISIKGLLKNIWQVKNVSFFTSTSALSPANYKSVKSHLCVLKGEVLNEFNEKCTHLTMSEISITVKLLHALLQNIPVVNCEYWQKVLGAIKNCNTLPKPTDYLPPRGPLLTSEMKLQYIEERQQLFKGFIFIFMNKKQMEMYADVIKKAGGKCQDLKSGVSKATLIKPKVCLIQYVPSTESQSSQTISSIIGSICINFVFN